MEIPQSITDRMTSWLRNARLVLLVGVGNQTRGDDGAGVLVAEMMERHSCAKLKVMNLGEALGRLLPDAIDLRPSHILVVDAAVFEAGPGSVRLMELGEADKVRFSSTHDLPVNVAVELVTSETGARALVVGIQPQTVCIGCEMSEHVRDACQRVVSMLESCLRSAGILSPSGGST